MCAHGQIQRTCDKQLPFHLFCSSASLTSFLPARNFPPPPTPCLSLWRLSSAAESAGRVSDEEVDIQRGSRRLAGLRVPLFCFNCLFLSLLQTTPSAGWGFDVLQLQRLPIPLHGCQLLQACVRCVLPLVKRYYLNI